jgi:hypothetical protein
MMGIEKEFFTEEEFKKTVNAPRSNCILNTDKLELVYKMKPLKEALSIAIGNLNG